MDGFIDFSFSVSNDDLQRAYDILMNQKNLDFEDIIKGSGFAKISLVGTGMQNTPGYATEMFTALGGVNIDIEMITTSEIRITCLINENHVNSAVNVLHSKFDLDKE